MKIRVLVAAVAVLLLGGTVNATKQKPAITPTLRLGIINGQQHRVTLVRTLGNSGLSPMTPSTHRLDFTGVTRAERSEILHAAMGDSKSLTVNRAIRKLVGFAQVTLITRPPLFGVFVRALSGTTQSGRSVVLTKTMGRGNLVTLVKKSSGQPRRLTTELGGEIMKGTISDLPSAPAPTPK